MILVGGIPGYGVLICVAGSLSLFYISGMFLNDAFDALFDREYRPERPIPSGLVTRRQVFMIGAVLMMAGEGLLALAGIQLTGRPDVWLLLGGVVLAVLILFYNYRHKNEPLSPVVMALCRAMIYLLSARAAGGSVSEPVLAGAVVLASYVIGLSYVAKQENLRRPGNLWPLLFLMAPLAYALPLPPRPDMESLLYGALLCWIIYSISFLVRRRGRSIPRAVVGLIAGIALVDGLLIVHTAGDSPWAIVTLAGFGLTLLFQRSIPGT
jgi:4-hydroxybenzoate polyprenyltransferase